MVAQQDIRWAPCSGWVGDLWTVYLAITWVGTCRGEWGEEQCSSLHYINSAESGSRADLLAFVLPNCAPPAVLIGLFWNLLFLSHSSPPNCHSSPAVWLWHGCQTSLQRWLHRNAKQSGGPSAPSSDQLKERGIWKGPASRPERTSASCPVLMFYHRLWRSREVISATWAQRRDTNPKPLKCTRTG